MDTMRNGLPQGRIWVILLYFPPVILTVYWPEDERWRWK